MTDMIRIIGLNELKAKMARRGRDIPAELEVATRKAVAYVHSTVPAYPPPPPQSTYRRTGTLGREIGTEVRPMGSKIIGLIGTNTVYAPWVISDEKVGSRGPQAWMHVGRWWTLQGVVHKAWGSVVKIYRDHFLKAIQ